ncbi:MAG: transposase [Candidatus Marinimicrobia bacterium]|nr:transposase [Candidatus Neomarinimicrobiota bacterium]
MLRGNGGTDLFFDDDDRYRFYILLQHSVGRYGCRVHAFCLMSSHIHIALQVGTILLSRVMNNLSLRYTRWINKRLERNGHLFQGRYKAILVDEDNYLLQLVSYLHLNPVRAGLEKQPEDYAWSSHRTYLGEETLPWLTVEPVLSQLSPKVGRAQKVFAEFVLQQINQGYRKDFHGQSSMDGRVCGEDSFVGQVLNQAEQEPLTRPKLMDVITSVKDLFDLSDDELQEPGQGARISEIRSMLAWAVLEMSDATLIDLSRWLGRDASSLSSAVQRLRKKASKSADIRDRMGRLKEVLGEFASLHS